MFYSALVIPRAMNLKFLLPEKYLRDAMATELPCWIVILYSAFLMDLKMKLQTLLTTHLT